ncbi:amidohydrolase family protein [Tautonia rosea]|uniref:hypothetical protein n=1 Tax=Tautonia rosea TaxID=2728037 RepID=UPI001474E3DF|nr:hypothetical protein [Tautonia rosea]
MNAPAPASPPRLIDLAVEWPLQYAEESTAIDAADYPGIAKRIGQVDGYLSTTLAAIIWIGPAPGDRPDPWGEISRLFAGVEAEFSGRILADAADLDRFAAEADDTLTWAVVGLRGCASFLQSENARDRLAALIDRGLRAVRLAGLVNRPADPTHDRGLTDLERSAISTLVSASSGRPLLLDLAGLPPTAASEAIGCLEAGDGGQLVPIVSLGGPMGGLRPDDLARLQTLGGVIGFCPARAFFPDAEAFGNALDEAAELFGVDLDAVAIGTGFLGITEPIEGLGNAPDLIDWLFSRFTPRAAQAMTRENVLKRVHRMLVPAHKNS